MKQRYNSMILLTGICPGGWLTEIFCNRDRDNFYLGKLIKYYMENKEFEKFVDMYCDLSGEYPIDRFINLGRQAVKYNFPEALLDMIRYIPSPSSENEFLIMFAKEIDEIKSENKDVPDDDSDGFSFRYIFEKIRRNANQLRKLE